MNALINRKTQFIHLGLIDYKQAWDYQASLFAKILEVKKANRDLPVEQQQPTENFLIFCEHPHVFTLGKSGDEANLKIKKENLHTIQASYVHTNRGGDITYHGPGQIVGYPVIDLENFFTDIHQYMRLLEEAVIQTLTEFGISSGRIPGLTGVWLDPDNESRARKICALGVKTSRWVAMHGFAFNVNADLNYFDYIVPCGIDDKAVTSMEFELGKKQDMKAVEEILKTKLAHLFEMELV
ncbi:MAG: lipoyl(octanoyl) transferase LipB [Cyclobacteriaceae bacterium]|nr:MAG: lipoyl(octanoyl) transferase LipB [Cyclobacteriaceae bacterium]